MAEAVADVLNITFNYEKAEKPFLHPYQTAAIFCEGEEIGYLGKVKYEIMKEEAMREDAYVLEISMKALEKWYGKAKVFEPLPKFPEEKRDLALVMDKDITCGQVEAVSARLVLTSRMLVCSTYTRADRSQPIRNRWHLPFSSLRRKRRSRQIPLTDMSRKC